MKIAFASAAVAAAVFAAPALGDPPPLSTPFAFESAAYNAGGGASNFHFGEGTATAAFTNPFSGVVTTYGTATITFAPSPYIELTATNPADPSGYANAHGELHYQFKVTTPDSAFQLELGNTYIDVASVSGYTVIATDGPAANVHIAATANGTIPCVLPECVGSFDDASAGGVYNHTALFDLSAPAYYAGDEIDILTGVHTRVFIGSILLQANVYGVTNSHPGFDDHGNPVTISVNDYPGLGGYAFIDPRIVIKPLFLQMLGVGGGTVTLSNGIGNASGPGVPEPSNWALLIAGFGLTGAAMRVAGRRRTFAAG